MTVKLQISGREFELTDRIRDYAEKKISKLDRHLNSVDEIHAELTKVKTARNSKDRYIAELTVRGKHVLLRSEERAEDIRTALTSAVDKMYRRMEHHKGKHYHGRGDGRSVSEIGASPKLSKSKNQSEIIRRKVFDLEPMNEHDAIAQMKMLGHDKFFVFLNVKTQNINIVYRRRDGTYGIIEPRI